MDLMSRLLVARVVGPVQVGQADGSKLIKLWLLLRPDGFGPSANYLK